MEHQYSENDFGCYADGALGHDHCRSRLADMLEGHLTAGHFSGSGAVTHLGTLRVQLVRRVVAALRNGMSDDAWEEDLALDAMNTLCVSDDVSFRFVGGDLVLIDCRE